MIRRALVGGPFVPAFDRESGSQRIHDFVTLLREAGWDVTYLAKDRAPGHERYVRLLRQAGVAVYHADEVDVPLLVATSGFDLAVLSFWHIGELWLPLIRRLSPATRILVDSIDLHFVRHARQRLASGRAGGAPLDDEYASQTVREINTFVASDGVLTVSTNEAEFLNALTGIDGLARVVPDNESVAPAAQVPRRGILFLGNFRHPPNVEAAEFLFTDIVPRLPTDLLEEHPVLVVGNAIDQRIRAMAEGLRGVRLVGWVPSVKPYLDGCALSVVPLLHGAGTKRKMIQSVLAGVPIVSTSVGVEGLPLVDGHDVLVADDAATFAAAVTQLLRDPDERARLSARGRRKVLRVHGRPAVAAVLAEVVERVLACEPKSAEFAEEHCRLHRPSLHADYWTYRSAVTRLREMLRSCVPPAASVAVISKGDEHLVDVPHLDVRHFPADPDGRYAGYYPTDGLTALAQLEAQIADGVRYLLVPNTAAWWLEHYAELGEALSRCSLVHQESGAGDLYELDAISAFAGGRQ